MSIQYGIWVEPNNKKKELRYMAVLGLSAKSIREVKRGLIFCLIFAVVVGHAGFWVELETTLDRHEAELTAGTLEELTLANAAYLEYLYSAVGQAQNLAYFLRSEVEDDAILRPTTLSALRDTMAIYGRYADLTVLNRNGVIMHQVDRDSIDSGPEATIGIVHFLFDQLDDRVNKSVYVSPMLPKRQGGAIATPAAPLVFVMVPIVQERDQTVSGYLVIKGLAGRLIAPFLDPLIRDFGQVSFKMSFPTSPFYWTYDESGWDFNSIGTTASVSAGDSEALSLAFSLEQADTQGRLIPLPKSHLEIYTSVDDRDASLGHYGLHPTLDAEVLMARQHWEDYLDGYTRRIWWEIYVPHVFGALALGLVMALCVAAFVFIRDRAWSRYQSERKRVETDHLTGVLSRLGFERALAERVDNGVNESSHALCVIDIDHFKQVNDRYGHAVGDQILCEVVHVLRQGLRDSDLLARWGGEEFILLLPLVDSKSVVSVAERFRMSVSQHKFRVDEDTNVSVTISIGVSFLEDEGFGAAFVKADEALYRAKHEGRNRVCIC